jgi:hypothetical protein
MFWVRCNLAHMVLVQTNGPATLDAKQLLLTCFQRFFNR